MSKHEAVGVKLALTFEARGGGVMVLASDIATALREAVAGEREACAVLVETEGRAAGERYDEAEGEAVLVVAGVLADAIRARSDT